MKRAGPVVYYVRCTVPGCDREWFLYGPRQGFVKAGALAHAHAHWRRFHLAHGGSPSSTASGCGSCADACWKGFEGETARSRRYIVYYLWTRE